MTRPTPAMRRAMAEAEVGDDGWGEDPTVRRLEEVFADRLGKAAGLFVPSGTMANQVALRTLAGPGKMVVAGRRQHVVMSENGAAGMNGAFQLYTVDDDEGRLDLAATEDAVAGDVGHSPEVAVIAVENTHMVAGGRATPAEALDAVAALGPPVHLDGARLFNAEVALGVPVARLAAAATTVTCCLSKGLGAPVGLGPGRSDRAHGRGPRAATAPRGRDATGRASWPPPACWPWTTMVDRLADDHAAGSPPRGGGGRPAFPTPSTRRGSTRTSSSSPTPIPVPIVAHLAGDGVLGRAPGRGAVRLVTHLDVDDGGIDRAVEVLARLPTPL